MKESKGRKTEHYNEIDLEDSMAFIGLNKMESQSSIGTREEISAGRSRGEEEERIRYDNSNQRDAQSHLSPEMERALNQMELTMKQAQLDREEASGMIEELRTSRKELKKSKREEDVIVRKQMKAKKRALKLHLEYLEHASRLQRKFKNRILANSGREEKEILQFCRLICGVLAVSHTKIQEVMNMPLENSVAYCKSIKLRTSGAMKFAQNNPKKTGAGAFGLGLVAAAGLTLVLGPFGTVMALAVTASTFGIISAQSAHEYTNTFKSLEKCASQLNPRGTKKRSDRNKLENTLMRVAAKETTAVPGVRQAPRYEQRTRTAPFGGSSGSEIDNR